MEQVKTAYRASKNADQTEGRGPMVTIAIFTNRADAIQAASGKGVMGVGNGDVEQINIYDSFHEYEMAVSEKVRERAMAKLTFEEKKALGLYN